jgi:hypothetical protein
MVLVVLFLHAHNCCLDLVMKRASLGLCSEPSWLGNMPVVRIPKWGNKGLKIIGWELFVQDCGNLTLACGTNGLSSLDPHSSKNFQTWALATIKTTVATSFVNKFLPKFSVCCNSSSSRHNSKRMALVYSTLCLFPWRGYVKGQDFI